jgi:DNA-directed RNA polymerase alpha subunit
MVPKNDQSMLRDKLFSALSILTNDTSEVWSTVAVLKIEELEDKNKKVVKLDSQIKKIRNLGIKSLKSLRKKVESLKRKLICRD